MFIGYAWSMQGSGRMIETRRVLSYRRSVLSAFIKWGSRLEDGMEGGRCWTSGYSTYKLLGFFYVSDSGFRWAVNSTATTSAALVTLALDD